MMGLEHLLTSVIDDVLEKFGLEREHVAELFERIKAELPELLQTAKAKLESIEGRLARIEETMTPQSEPFRNPLEKLVEEFNQWKQTIMTHVESMPAVQSAVAEVKATLANLPSMETIKNAVMAEVSAEVAKVRAELPTAAEISERLSNIEKAIASLLEINKNAPRPGTSPEPGASSGDRPTA